MTSEILNALQILGLIAIVIAGIPFLRGKRKDGVIKEQGTVIKSHEAHIKVLKLERDEARARREDLQREVIECSKQIAALQARYEEQAKYTAREALEEVRLTVASQESTLKTAVSALSELVQKNLEVTARLVGAIEGQGVSWSERVPGTASPKRREHDE